MRWFLAGFGIGFGAGVLIAPQRGRDTRDQIAAKAEEWFEAARDEAVNLAHNPGQLLGPLRDRASELNETVTATLQHGRELAGNIFEDGAASALNSASREQLLAVYGVGPVLAEKIISERPYRSFDDLLERNIVPQPVIENLKRDLKRSA